MLEYSIKEAEALLSKNLNTAQKNLKEIEEDLGFLRDQYTTTEVSILQIRVILFIYINNIKVYISIKYYLISKYINYVEN